MLKIGLTGGIGSGKTSVSDLFAEQDIPVIDTDVIAHDLANNDDSVLQQISDTFGEDVLKLNGELNRQKLARIVFNNRKNRQSLEKILHPRIKSEVRSRLEKLLSSNTPPNYVIIVAPLLIEANYQDIIDRILVVTADEAIRINRVQLRDKRSLSEIQAIMKNQIDEQQRLDQADDIINNNSNIKALEEQVATIHEKYQDMSRALN